MNMSIIFVNSIQYSKQPTKYKRGGVIIMDNKDLRDEMKNRIIKDVWDRFSFSEPETLNEATENFFTLSKSWEELEESSSNKIQEDYPRIISMLQMIRNLLIKQEISPKYIKIMLGPSEEKEDRMYQLNKDIEATQNLTRLIQDLYKEYELTKKIKENED